MTYAFSKRELSRSSLKGQSGNKFVHLHVHSDHSFGDGTGTVEELVRQAARHEQKTLAITDTNRLSAIPSFVRACGYAGILPIGGCEIILEDETRLTLLMDGSAGWRSLCRVLSLAGLRDRTRTHFRVRWDDLEENTEGLVCLSGSPEYGRVPLLLHRRDYEGALQQAKRLVLLFGQGNVYLEVVRSMAEREKRVSGALAELAEHLRLPLIATNAVRHVRRTDYAIHEVLRRIGLHLSPDEEHGEMPLNAERYLKHGETMRLLFADIPDALHNTVRLAERLAVPFEAGVWHLPQFPDIPNGENAWSYLGAITWRGAGRRYGKPLPTKVIQRLTHELETIRETGFSDYFLVCADICTEARRRQVRYALRGSAVGSAVAYCLGIGQHDPIAHGITFDRFLSRHRRKPPDIDIDFAHNEREGIMEWTRERHGQEKVAGLVNYVRWRGRSLLRDVSSAIGYDTHEIERLRELLVYCDGESLAETVANRPELRALNLAPAQYEALFEVCTALAGKVRHYGTHSSGILVSNVPLMDVVPLRWAAKGVVVACLDKDDVEADGIGLLKIDQLSLRTLSSLENAQQAIRQTEPSFDLRRTDLHDAETFAMIRRGETVGVFQLESPAQMSLQQRFGAERLGDLTQSVALIRPGPALGGSIDEYIARRHGWQRWTYPLPELAAVLEETYGRIVYQDQVLDVIRIVGDLPHDEADRWLKTMTHARDPRVMEELGQDLFERARRKGMDESGFATVWRQVKGFARYGFCHGHAFAFAHHAHSTAYLLQHYPAEYLAAVLSQQPCGFWPLSTVVGEAMRRGVTVLSPSLFHSDGLLWLVTKTADEKPAIRPSLLSIRGLGEIEAQRIVERRGEWKTFESVAQGLSTILKRDAVEWLALSGALDALEPNRRRALWRLTPTGRKPFKVPPPPLQVRLEMENTDKGIHPVDLALPDFGEQERFRREWDALGFSPRGNPMQFRRKQLTEKGVSPCASLSACTDGERITIAGLLLRPHRPPTPSGMTVVFFALEDETGLVQVTMMPDVYEQYGHTLFGQTAVAIYGRAQRRGSGVTLIALRGFGMNSPFENQCSRKVSRIASCLSVLQW